MSGAAWMFIVFIFTLLIGVPIPIAAGIATAVGLLLIDIPFTLLAQTAYSAFEPFPVLAIPLFILAGQLMERGGMSQRLIVIAQRLVGSYRGGLGHVTVVACTFFAALSGSGPATTAAVGSITIPAMRDEKYSPGIAAALAASSGALGSMIPPSNLLIIYALVTNESIPRLFLAGILPGILVAILLLATTYVIARLRGYGGHEERFRWIPLLHALWEGKWAVGAPVLILGGIYVGAFTPTEAAGVAVLYGLLVGTIVYRDLTLKEIYAALLFTARMAGSVLLILGPTQAFGQLVTMYDVPSSIEVIFTGLTQSPTVVLLLIGLLYLLVGMWIESLPQILIFTPILLPIAAGLGVDPVVFGVFTVLTCEIGFLTPPVGVNLFVAARIADISIGEVSVGVLPFIVPYLLCMTLLAFSWDWVLFLPNLVYGAH